MKTCMDCLPCFVKQALGAARLATDDEKLREEVLRVLLKEISGFDINQSPPLMGRLIHRRVRQLLANDDPYKKIKEQYNRRALKIYPELAGRVASSARPFETAVRLAIAGNIIDFGANLQVDMEMVNKTIERSFSAPLFGDIELFIRAVEQAGEILYLADNAGEIVFDRLLLEQLPRERVTVAVRGAPVINDATREDAVTAGLTEMVPVIDNGTDIPGTVPEECSPSFRKVFERADLVIAKGQGNYETLSDGAVRGEIFFLFQTKCAVAAAAVGCAEGRFVLLKKGEVDVVR